jgi:hypothetical protein
LASAKNGWDGVLAATTAGMIATLAKDLPNFFSRFFGLVNRTYWELAASAFVRPPQIHTIPGWIVGGFADLILGGALGVVVLMVFRGFGRDLWWYKGLVSGNVIWFVGLAIGAHCLSNLPPTTALFNLEALVEHQIFGLMAAYLIWR